MSVANQAPFQDFADLCAVARLDPPQLTAEQRVAQDALWDWFSTLSLEQRMQITAVCDSDWIASLIAMYRAASAFPESAPAAAPASPARGACLRLTPLAQRQGARTNRAAHEALRASSGWTPALPEEEATPAGSQRSPRASSRPRRHSWCIDAASVSPFGLGRTAQQGGQARVRHRLSCLQQAGVAGHPAG